MFATSCPTNSFFVSEFASRAVRKKHFLLLHYPCGVDGSLLLQACSPYKNSLRFLKNSQRDLWKEGFCTWGGRGTRWQQGQWGVSPSLCCPDISVWQNWQPSSNCNSQAIFPWSLLPEGISLVLMSEFRVTCWWPADPGGSFVKHVAFSLAFSAASSHFLLPCYLPLGLFPRLSAGETLSVSKCLCAKFICVHKHVKATIKVQKNEYMLMYSVIIKPEKGEKKAVILSL